MSHFTVLVITDDGDNTAALAPFHEFECTGEDDEFVIDVDLTAEAREKFETDTAVSVLERPDGSRFYPFGDDGNYIEEVVGFYDRHEGLVLPEGWKDLSNEPAKDWMDFAGWACGYYGLSRLGEGEPHRADLHKFGWVRVVEGEVTEVIRHTNPQAKWDWWVVGGRWSGRLAGKDQLRRRSLDFDKLKRDAITSRQEQVREWCEKASYSQDKLEKAFWQAPQAEENIRRLMEGRKLSRADAEEEVFSDRLFSAYFVLRQTLPLIAYQAPDLRPFEGSLAKWIEAAPAVTSHAILKDGQWIERGQMGWFASVSNGQPVHEWDKFVTETIKELPNDKWITLVDCHI